MELVEDELIEEIEQLDEGWWSGVGSNGAKSGLFPGEFRSEILGGWFNIFTYSQLCRVGRAGGRAGAGTGT